MMLNEPGNAGRSQIMQGLGGHTKHSRPHPKSNGDPLRILARGVTRDCAFEKINSGCNVEKMDRLTGYRESGDHRIWAVAAVHKKDINSLAYLMVAMKIERGGLIKDI